MSILIVEKPKAYTIFLDDPPPPLLNPIYQHDSILFCNYCACILRYILYILEYSE